MEHIDFIQAHTDEEFAAKQLRDAENRLHSNKRAIDALRLLVSSGSTILPLLVNAYFDGWSRSFRQHVRRLAVAASQVAKSLRRSSTLAQTHAELFSSATVVGMIQTHDRQGAAWLMQPDTIRSQADAMSELSNVLRDAANGKSKPETALLAWIVRHVKMSTGSEQYERLSEILSIDADVLRHRVSRFGRSKWGQNALSAIIETSLGSDIKIANPVRNEQFVVAISPEHYDAMRVYCQLGHRTTGEDIGLSIEEQVNEALDGYIDTTVYARCCAHGTQLPGYAPEEPDRIKRRTQRGSIQARRTNSANRHRRSG